VILDSKEWHNLKYCYVRNCIGRVIAGLYVSNKINSLIHVSSPRERTMCHFSLVYSYTQIT